MFHQVRVSVLGVIENMSYFQCPKCNERTHIFSHGGAAATASKFGVPFLGEVPLSSALREGGDSGKPIVVSAPDSPGAQAFIQIAQKVAVQVSMANLNKANSIVIE
jgi:ATP-binding protein involved in chromosome partitioning